MTQLSDFRAGERVRIPTSDGVTVATVVRGTDRWWKHVELVHDGSLKRVWLPAETPAEADDE